MQKSVISKEKSKAQDTSMIIVWHYRDLRLGDHPALSYASNQKAKVLPLYIHDPKVEGKWPIGAASSWWLHHSLCALASSYKKKGGNLIIRKGDALKAIQTITKQYEVREVCWIERYEPALRKRDKTVIKSLEKMGIVVKIFPGNYLVDPSRLLNKTGKPFRVFTPFYRAMRKELELGSSSSAPRRLTSQKIAQGKVDDLQLLPKKHWYTEIEKLWKPGEKQANSALRKFSQKLSSYSSYRDIPSRSGTSLLSPHLHFGEISPRQVWQNIAKRKGGEPFLRQLAWREFSNYFLYHFPQAANTSWRKEFEKIPWTRSSKALEKWQKGMTGYPIIDAGMRQLWRTGWMHNRVRMIVASFLVKDLMIHWREGARWFWDTLLDADLANNTMGWQWAAGSGPDAAPYFRIFNPILQGKKFDPKGEYVRQFVPELKALPTRYIHSPWDAPEEVLEESGIEIGVDYPAPIVDHATSRKRALKAFEKAFKS